MRCLPWPLLLTSAIQRAARRGALRATLRGALLSALLALLGACGAGDKSARGIAAGGVDPTPLLPCTITNDSLGPHALPATLPDKLQWQTNQTDAEFADPQAKRGGLFRTFILSFPMTLRRVGPDSNGAFAGYTRALQLGTTQRHPNTLNHIPQLATSWAFGADGKSIFFKLNPKARWSDGQPVKAEDYLFAVYQMRSKFIVDPWYNDYYTNVLVDVRKYDDHTIGIAGKAPRPPDEMLEEYGLTPTACHAHKLDAKWLKDYNWRVEPVTGPYQISRMEKGKFVEFTRIANWWGDDERYYRYRFNPDTVRVTVVRDPNAAYRLFEKGELDAYGMTTPDIWHDKARGELYDKGYIGKLWYYTDSPSAGAGFWLNMDDPLLADRNVRLGLAHSMNFDKMIATVLRGDYTRSNIQYAGYGVYSNNTIKARPFDVAAAGRYFAAAGFTKRGPDGIRVRGNQRLQVRVTYGNPRHSDRLTVLQSDARQAGVDLQLQLLDSSAAFKQMRTKQHQIAWEGWAGAAFVPAFWEFYHSDNAHKPDTNNVVNMADPQMDKLIDDFRASTDKPHRAAVAQQIEQKIFDSGAFIPGTRVPYVRDGFWRWLKLPAFHGTRLSGFGLSAGLFDPLNDGLFWIDTDEQKKTLAALKQGTSFPRINVTDTTWKRRAP